MAGRRKRTAKPKGVNNATHNISLVEESNKVLKEANELANQAEEASKKVGAEVDTVRDDLKDVLSAASIKSALENASKEIKAAMEAAALASSKAQETPKLHSEVDKAGSFADKQAALEKVKQALKEVNDAKNTVDATVNKIQRCLDEAKEAAKKERARVEDLNKKADNLLKQLEESVSGITKLHRDTEIKLTDFKQEVSEYKYLKNMRTDFQACDAVLQVLKGKVDLANSEQQCVSDVRKNATNATLDTVVNKIAVVLKSTLKSQKEASGRSKNMDPIKDKIATEVAAEKQRIDHLCKQGQDIASEAFAFVAKAQAVIASKSHLETEANNLIAKHNIPAVQQAVQRVAKHVKEALECLNRVKQENTAAQAAKDDLFNVSPVQKQQDKLIPIQEAMSKAEEAYTKVKTELEIAEIALEEGKKAALPVPASMLPAYNALTDAQKASIRTHCGKGVPEGTIANLIAMYTKYKP